MHHIGKIKWLQKQESQVNKESIFSTHAWILISTLETIFGFFISSISSRLQEKVNAPFICLLFYRLG